LNPIHTPIGRQEIVISTPGSPAPAPGAGPTPGRARRGRPPGAAQESAQESTRDRILRIAAEVFAEYGYHGASMAQLGEAAGLQRGALYYHIGSKEELLYDLSRRHVEEALERGRRVVESDLPPTEKFRTLAREHLETLTSRQAEVVVVLREMHALTGERAERLVTLRAAYEALFTQVLEEGAAAGVVRGRPDVITTHAVLGMYNSATYWFQPGHGLSAAELADRFSDLLLDGLAD
jgi:AcrR family transcriptional regulator